jgi:hypothetical protein
MWCDSHDGVDVSDRRVCVGTALTVALLAVVLVAMAVFFMGFLALFAGVAVVGTAAAAMSRTSTHRKLGQ